MKNKGYIIWIMFAAVLLILLNLPLTASNHVKSILRDALAPLQELLADISDGINETAASIRGIKDLGKENKSLALEVVRLRNEVHDLETLRQENLFLREQLQFSARSTYQLVPCEVIARSSDGWWQSIRIGKGAVDGLTMDMAVITLDGLIGKTVQISSRTSDVLLISDPTCKVSVQISRTGSYAVMQGGGPVFSGNVVCRMSFINKAVPVQAGDEVVTSGLGGIFPRGLIIGYADNITMDESGLYQEADVIPRADPGMLEYVFVVVKEEDPFQRYLEERGVLPEGGDL